MGIGLPVLPSNTSQCARFGDCANVDTNRKSLLLLSDQMSCTVAVEIVEVILAKRFGGRRPVVFASPHRTMA